MGVTTYTKTERLNEGIDNTTLFFIAKEDIKMSLYDDSSKEVCIEKDTIIYIKTIKPCYKEGNERIGFRIHFYYVDNKNLDDREVYVSNMKYELIKSLLIQTNLTDTLQKKFNHLYLENINKEEQAYKKYFKWMINSGFILTILLVPLCVFMGKISDVDFIWVLPLVIGCFIWGITFSCLGDFGIKDFIDKDKCVWFNSLSTDKDRKARAFRNALKDTLKDESVTFHTSNPNSVFEKLNLING